MDSNGTRFQLLLDRPNWAQCVNADGSSILPTATNVISAFSWNSRSEVTLGKRVNLFPSAAANQVPAVEQRRGAGQDRFGNWYFIGSSLDELLVTSSGTSITSHFWSSQDELSPSRAPQDGSFGVLLPGTQAPPLVFSGLTVTELHYLVVGVVEPAGFVVFDLFHGGPPRQFAWPSNIDFEPFDMSPAPGGGVWILDRKNRRVWALDRAFSVIRQDQDSIDLSQAQGNVFTPSDGSAPAVQLTRTFPAGISIGMGSTLGAIDAIAIETLPDGTVLLLESLPGNQFSTIYRLRYGQIIGKPVQLDIVLAIIAPADQVGFSLLGFDFAMIALEQTPYGQRANTLYVVAANGDQAWAFTAGYDTDQLILTPLEEFYPMRLFGGRGIVAGPSRVYYDSQDRWTPLVIQRRPRYVEEAELFTRVFDSHEPDTTWHKLILEAAIPADTQVTVYSRSHNDDQILKAQDWFQEPDFYQRGDGSELPWTTTAVGLETWELLFQQASGRFLQLRMVLSGNGRLTPRIRALRAYYPRFSYLEHYLPSAYREDPRSASFLDRFLANFEGFYTSIEDRVATVQALLDASSAPSETLDWLANWFGVALDPAWSDVKRRQFLLHASAFFEARGTLPGLMMALRLTLEDCVSPDLFSNPVQERTGPRIVEGFRTRRLPLGLLQTTPNEAGLPSKLQTAAWTPAQGADELDSRYRASLNLPQGATYPISVAAGDPVYSQWAAFSTSTIGFVPKQPDPATDLWAVLLRSRYSVIDALNQAYRTAYVGFADVPFPAQLPRSPGPLLDWYQFQGTLLVQAAAHRFTIFLPMPVADAQNTQAHRAKLDLVQRVAALEKPAHTTFEIKFYWAFFRVGEARLAADTVLDYGSRAPQLLRPVELGDSYTGSGYLSRQQPCDPRERQLFKPRSCR